MNVFDLYAKISLDKTEYDKGLDDASSQGSSFAEKISTTFGKVGGALSTIAKVGVAAFAAIGTASAAVTTEFVRGASEMASYGDNIDKMSQKMGMSAEAYQEWDAVMQHSGTSIESMQASMKTLANAVENGNKAFERLGMTEEQIAGMNQEELFSATITALQNVEDTTERTYLAGQLLGRGATELGALLNTSAEDTQAMKDRVHELGGVMSNEAVKASAQFQDNLQDLQTALAGTKRSIMADVLPGLNSLMDGFTKLLNNEDGADELITSGIDSLLESMDRGIDRAIDLADTLLPKIATTIGKHLPKLLSTGAKILKTIGSAILKDLPQIVKTGATMIADLVKGMAQGLPEAIPAALDVIFDIIDAFTDPEVIVSLVEAALQLMIGLTEGLISAIPVLIERVPEIVESLAEALVEAAPIILESLVTIGQMLWDAIIKYGGQLLTWLGGLGSDLIAWIKESGSNALDATVEWLSSLPEKFAYWAGYAIGQFIKFMAELPDRAYEFFSDLLVKLGEFGVTFIEEAPRIASEFRDKLLEFIIELPEKFKEIGANIVTGLWNGIKAGWDWLTKKVKDLANSLLEGVKDALDINSPSKKFEWVGKMVDEGFALGVRNNEDIAQMQVEKSLGMQDWSTSVGSANDVATANTAKSDVAGNSSEDRSVRIELAIKPDEKRLFKEMQKQGRLYQDSTGKLVFG